jgi:formylglycine-generating enzyme required for sulfatase activity
MSGNVLEWCWNWYNYIVPSAEYPAATPTGDVVASISSNKRILRGGSWDGIEYDCLVWRRHSHESYGLNINIGFRVVCK